MLIILSPAKNLDFKSLVPTKTHTFPEFTKESSRLIRELRKLSPKKLQALMNISEKLAILNFERFHS